VGVSLAPDFPFIVLRQLEVDEEIVLWNGIGKALPAFPLGLREKVDRHTIPLSKKGSSSSLLLCYKRHDLNSIC
jgi:hypothetical protein